MIGVMGHRTWGFCGASLDDIKYVSGKKLRQEGSDYLEDIKVDLGNIAREVIKKFNEDDVWKDRKVQYELHHSAEVICGREYNDLLTFAKEIKSQIDILPACFAVDADASGHETPMGDDWDRTIEDLEVEVRKMMTGFEAAAENWSGLRKDGEVLLETFAFHVVRWYWSLQLRAISRADEVVFADCAMGSDVQKFLALLTHIDEVKDLQASVSQQLLEWQEVSLSNSTMRLTGQFMKEFTKKKVETTYVYTGAQSFYWNRVDASTFTEYLFMRGARPLALGNFLRLGFSGTCVGLQLWLKSPESSKQLLAKFPKLFPWSSG